MLSSEAVLALVPENKKEAAAAELNAKRAGMPVIIKAVLGFGAFFSAIFFFASLGTVSYLLDNEVLLLAIGFIFMGASILFNKFLLPKFGPMMKFFCDQFLLVAMFFARLCIFVGVAKLLDYRETEALINVFLSASFLLMVLPYKFFDSAADRFLSVLTFMAMVYARYFYWLGEWEGFVYINFTSIVLASFIISALLLIWRKKSAAPAAWGMVCSMLIPVAISLFFAEYLNNGVNAAMQTPYTVVMFNWHKVILALFLGGLFYAYRYMNTKTDAKIFPAVFILAIPFNLPVLYSIFYLLAGQYFRDWKIKVLGYCVLSGGIFYLYYSMSVSLLTKSLLLMAGGAVLFGVREILKRFVYAR
ncbi:hypothetical protein Dip510_000949 [Elusimicrobium posterum]|uniref:DUF4401 domain-containing protein n=1 Tax=Elusimicrobium posterum TaxID=3116653 RepID=UPI003C76EC0B